MINFISNYKDKIIFVISIFLLFLSFYYNEDGTGGGAKGDFEVTYGFIIALQENLLADPKDWTLVHTPLHFIILSYVTRIISNTDLKELGTLFKDNFDLSESIYELKGSSIFGLDFNSIASFFGVISLILKQNDKKLLSILFFILCILCFSRSVIFFTFVFLIIHSKKINMQIFIPIITTALVFFINYLAYQSLL